VKAGDLVRYNFSRKANIDCYGVGILISFSTSGDFAEVLWSGLGMAWSSVKFLEVINESR
jgi:hypothetical protein